MFNGLRKSLLVPGLSITPEVDCGSGPHHKQVSCFLHESPSLLPFCPCCCTHLGHRSLLQQSLPLVLQKAATSPQSGPIWPGTQEPGQGLLPFPQQTTDIIQILTQRTHSSLHLGIQRVCPPPTAHLGSPDPKPSMLYHCQTLPESSFYSLPGLSGRKRGEGKAEWAISLKRARGGVSLLELMCAYPRRD